MHDRYLYGKDFTRSFIVEEDNEPFKLPSQTPTIYIFTEKPTRDEAQAGTGAVQTISSWNQNAATPYACLYAVSAIVDPDPDAADDNEQWYWEAVNYITKTGGQTQTAIRGFVLSRGFQPSNLPEVAPEDLAAVYPAISEYIPSDQLRAMIASCLEDVIMDLETKGIEWGRLSDKRRLHRALAFKSIAEASFSQVKGEGDKFHLRYTEFTKKYASAMTAVNLPYDADGDSSPELIEKPRKGYAILDT